MGYTFNDFKKKIQEDVEKLGYKYLTLKDLSEYSPVEIFTDRKLIREAIENIQRICPLMREGSQDRIEMDSNLLCLNFQLEKVNSLVSEFLQHNPTAMYVPPGRSHAIATPCGSQTSDEFNESQQQNEAVGKWTNRILSERQWRDIHSTVCGPVQSNRDHQYCPSSSSRDR